MSPDSKDRDDLAFIVRLREDAAKREREGLTRSLRTRGPKATWLDMAGNDYLGLATDRRICEAAAAAALRWGAGSAASRLVTGDLELHRELEQELATFCRQPAALVFSSGYLANLGVITALASKDTLIVSDAHIHASLIDACRLSRARIEVVPHGDLLAVETALRTRSESQALVLAESVYSVLGDAAPVDELAEISRRLGAVLVIDEAHGIGICGPEGRGLVEERGLTGRPDVVVTATLSKALGSQGGVVMGAPEVIEHLINTARPFIFDTGLNPAACAGALAALGVITEEPFRVKDVHLCSAALAGAAALGPPSGAVLSVPVGSPDAAVDGAAKFLEEGIRVGCFRPPSVPDGISRLRLTARATLRGEELERATRVVRGVLEKVVRS